jgi:hypothetical protein
VPDGLVLRVESVKAAARPPHSKLGILRLEIVL